MLSANPSDDIPNRYPLPPISEKTQRELAASAEQWMRSRSQQGDAKEKSGRTSSSATRNANPDSNPNSDSNANSNTNANSNADSGRPCLPDKDKDVDAKPPETNLESDEKAEMDTSS